MAGFTLLIKFLGDKLLYGQIPDPFPRCGIGSGHARLWRTMASFRTPYFLYVYACTQIT